MTGGGPNNVLQFTSRRMTDEEHKRIRAYYFGECGDGQGFWPDQHRWGRWKTHIIKATGARFKERICSICSLASDPVWLDGEDDE